MALRAAAERAGRDPDEVKFFAGIMTTIAPPGEKHWIAASP